MFLRLPFPVLAGVHGRAEDLIYMEDTSGTPVSVPPVLFSAGLSEIGSIVELQVLRLPDGIGLRIVPNEGIVKGKVEAAVLEKVRGVLAERGMLKVHIEIELLENLSGPRRLWASLRLCSDFGDPHLG